MECERVRSVLQDAVDGRLPPPEAADVREHLRACAECAAEEAAFRRVGELLRTHYAARVSERDPQLDFLWTRVRARIEENRRAETGFHRHRRWLWIPAAAALAVLFLLFYPSKVSRAPFRPGDFHIAVESLDSETATVALVDKGEDLPRVIWIIEDENT